MSDQDYYRIDGINSVLKLIDPDIKNRIIAEYLHYPKAYAEIVDTDSEVTTLASCSNYSINLNTGNLVDSFSCTLQKAMTWNPRTSTYSNLLEVDKRKRVNLYYGQAFSGTPKYERVFTGVITNVPEDYGFGGDERIQLKGSSLRHLLERYEGGYLEDINFTGTSKELIAYWLDQLDVDYALVYTDYVEFDDEEIAYDTMLTGINTILTALGPRVEAFFSPMGVFIMRDVPDGVEGDVEFEYDASNIIKLRRYTDSDDVTTVASVIGADDDAVADGEATAAMINQYGRNIKTISSGFILTADRAEQLVKDMLDVGNKYQNRYEIQVSLNPYIWKSSVVKIDETSVSMIEEALVRVESASHYYRAGVQQTTRIRGHDA